MKAAKRSILICVLTLILSVSLLAGVTFAWFTDSITNSGNTIQSGELAIDATAYDRVDTEAGGLTVTIGEGNVASGTYYFEAEGTSLRNGDPVITEENWQPGDMNAKLFTVSNEGSIDAVVSLDFFVSGDLAEAMWYDFIAVDPADGSLLGEFLQRNDLNTISDLADSYGEVTLKPEEQVTFLFVYGLPTSATNEAMNKAVNVNVVVSAKQNVEGAEGPVVVNPGTDLSETTIDSGDTILLSEGDYEVSQPVVIENKENIVIDGNGATLTTSDAISGISTLASNGGNIIEIAGASNVTIRNLTISGAEHHGINIWESTDVVVENVTIENSGAAAITINASEVTLNNVTTSGSAWGGVNVDDGDEESTIKTVLTVDENCAFDEFLPIYADSEDIANAVTVNVPENYNKAIVDLTGIGEDGVKRVVWSPTIVETEAELNSAVVNGGYVILANDVKGVALPSTVTTDATIYLNNKTLISTQTYSTTISNGATLNFISGSVEFTGMEAVDASSLVPISGSAVSLDNVKLTSNGTALFPRGDAARVEVVNSEITAPVYAVGTNAGKVDNYNVEIYIYGSTLKTYYTDPTSGSITVFVNVPCSLTIENSYIYGVQNAVMVRCGTATIKKSTLSTPNGVSLDDINLEATWSSGNEVPFGTLLVGNGTTTYYQNAATVTVENTTITSDNENVPAIYIWGNATEEIGATLTVDEFTWTNKTGNLAGDPAGAYGDVTVNLPDGYTLVDTYEELSTAVAGGGYIVLSNDITVVPVGVGDALFPQMNIYKNTTLYLNGKTLSFDKTATTESLSYTPAFFGVMTGATFTVYGEGVIDAEAGYNTAYGINVFGGNLVINGGTYYGAMSAVQVQTGTCTINGGHFELADTIKEAAPQYSTYLINCIDANFSNGTAVVYVKGGTFVNYNPSASQGEPNAPVSFVDGENYEVKSVVQSNGETWYTVVPKA